MFEMRRANAKNRSQIWPSVVVGGWFLIGSVGCNLDEPEPALPEGPHPVQRADDLRVALQEAQNAWSNGKRAEARTRVLSAYRQWFEPIEPVLREEDALATLQLEFQFGALAHRMSQKGDPVGLNDAVMALVDGMDGLVQRLPAPAEGVLEQTPLASDALPVAVEVTAPKSELTTYGDAKN